jgi:hypothetical protein
MSELSTTVVLHCAWCGLPFHPWPSPNPNCCSRQCAGHLRGSKPIANRFWPKVIVKGSAECWLWKGSKNQDGYGVIWHVDRLRGAHRISWLLNRGPIPDGLDVLHKCDVRLCCNPEHLFLGTHGDNCNDRTRKERSAKGEAHGRSKLTNEQVIEIRARFAAGQSARVVAEAFGVTKGTVRHIKMGRHWKHLSTEPETASVET